MKPETTSSELLRRELMFFRRVCIALIAALGVLLLVAQSKPRDETVTLRHLVLVDKAGQTRAELKADEAGVYLLMYHGNGKPGASVAVRGPAAGITAFDAEGKTRFVLVGDDAGSRLHLLDERQRSAVGLMAAEGATAVRLDGPEELPLPLGLISVDSSGLARLQLAGTNGKVRSRLSVAKDGAGKLELFGSAGEATASLPHR